MPNLINHTASLQTFKEMFPAEEDCIRTLFSLRWPQGFICPFCHTRHPDRAPQRYITCSHCGNRSSLTTGTIMHGAKKPVRDWLLAIWWFSSSQFGTSAKELQRLLALSCYQTAWTWLQKLRLAMGEANRTRCRGVVEIGCGAIVPARERKESALVLTAAELILTLGTTGRIHMLHIRRLDTETLMGFLHAAVESNSSLLTANEPVAHLMADSSSYYLAPVQSTPPSRTEELNRSFETSLHTVHRGGVTVKHLQRYLDEFCFRNNAALLPDHQAVFRALLTGVFSEPLKHHRDAPAPPGSRSTARRPA
jgi:hypothetical protein